MHASPTCLRRVAGRLDAVRDELDCPAAGALDDVDPEWSAAAALRALTAELDTALVGIARLSGEAAEALRQCATAYETSDDRAARRLAPTPVASWA